MSLAKLFYVRCDSCGRPCGNADDVQDNGSDARAFAKRSGWKRRHVHGTAGGPLGDICTTCQANRASWSTSR